jgi:hypothetical protein
MCTLPKAVRMAKKMGEGLGRSPFLLGPVQGREITGAGYKVRTRDPLITNQVLYQLS